MLRSTLICLATALAGLVSTVASATTAAGQQQQGTIMHWTVDGVERDALVFAPRATQGAARHPLVIAFHGHGGRMLEHRRRGCTSRRSGRRRSSSTRRA